VLPLDKDEAIMSLQITGISPSNKQSKSLLPLFTVPISAGFPSPAEDYIENKIDLNELIIRRPVATFFVRVEGDSMINAGIHSGDLLVVDRSLQPRDNKIIIAIVDGEFTVKRIRKRKGKLFLVPENPEYTQVEVKRETDFQVWGVVTYVIHKAQ